MRQRYVMCTIILMFSFIFIIFIIFIHPPTLFSLSDGIWERLCNPRSAFCFRCQMGFGSDYVTPTFADNIYNKTIAKEGVGSAFLFR